MVQIAVEMPALLHFFCSFLEQTAWTLSDTLPYFNLYPSEQTNGATSTMTFQEITIYMPARRSEKKIIFLILLISRIFCCCGELSFNSGEKWGEVVDLGKG